MANQKKYNIGLDLGTSSVGWCVTDENNNILKKNGKNMWGSRIFSEANTAAQTRSFRGNRRRIDRRKERIKILQSLLQEDINEEYPNFFPMLKESSLLQEDKTKALKIDGIKYNIFSEQRKTDKTYYDQFPTIYHLRKYLINEKEKVDIRLVYLAIHHIIKYRGNFLYEGDFSNNIDLINESIEEIVTYLKEKYQIYLQVEMKEIINILSNKNTIKSEKKEELIELFDYEKEDKKIVKNIINAILGYKFSIFEIFDLENEDKISFSSEIENEEEILSCLGEEQNIYCSLKNIYSWYALQDLLGGEKYISNAFIKRYEQYNDELNILKKLYKNYLPNLYNNMFREYKEHNYVAYNGKNKGKSNKKCKREDLYKTIKNDLKNLDDKTEEKKIIIEKIENDEFLRKLNITDNGAIPNQLHKNELIEILNNQEKFYPALKENKERIIELLTFRIPYYVGPLAKNENSKWAWVVRKNESKILPWTFDDVVDKDLTAEKFIKRMTNKCTYLLNEDVMPKQSLLYSKFCVLNELNNIRINEHHIPKSTKKKIINELFLNKKKVTKDMLKKLYEQDGKEVINITGLNETNTFNSNMASYVDLFKILGKIDESNYDMCEKIIYWITIFEDKSILKHKIQKEFPQLSNEQIKQLIKLKYTGWSRLSNKLIDGLKSFDRNETIMEKLESTSMNFMQIINKEEFGFKQQLQEMMPQINKKITYKDVEEIPTSPANKRAIWQALLVVKEIVKIQGNEPNNIYIEFAREENEKGKMTEKRTKQLLDKYKDIENLKRENLTLYKELKAHQTDREISEKLYLYFIQMGKCLYSGKTLDIEKLSEYQVDHIIPQSYIKDDSIDNKALVLAKENQRKADDLLLVEEIQKNRRSWWEYLLKNKLITPEKFRRLTRNKMFETDEDKVKFVNRQLVETRQITKYVTNLLKNEFQNTNIFSLRSDITYNFRNRLKLYKNRNINNCHHAQDAYIMCVSGNILNKEWGNLNDFKYGKYVNEYMKDEEFKNRKDGIVVGFVLKRTDISKVKRVINYKDYFISRMLEEQTGTFYNQTLYSPKDKPVINLKDKLNAEKYGGYSGEQKGYYCIYQYIDTKQNIGYRLVGIPIKITTDIKNNKTTIEEYIKSTYKNEQFLKIIRNKIMKNQEYVDEYGDLMMFRSDSEIKTAKQLIIDSNLNELIYAINIGFEEKYQNQYDNIYEYIFDNLVEKLKNEYHCYKNIYLKLLDSKEIYLKLDNKDKKIIINEITKLMSNSNANLKLLNMADRIGRMAGKKFETKQLMNMIFIDKSVTGMYERRFKINGMENSCSK